MINYPKVDTATPFRNIDAGAQDTGYWRKVVLSVALMITILIIIAVADCRSGPYP